MQSFRKRGGALSGPDKKLIWFWAAVIVVAMLLMFGRFAPFYQFFYALPYVSTIRNPAKFQHIVEWALIILSAYEPRRYGELDSPVQPPPRAE